MKPFLDEMISVFRVESSDSRQGPLNLNGELKRNKLPSNILEIMKKSAIKQGKDPNFFDIVEDEGIYGSSSFSSLQKYFSNLKDKSKLNNFVISEYKVPKSHYATPVKAEFPEEIIFRRNKSIHVRDANISHIFTNEPLPEVKATLLSQITKLNSSLGSTKGTARGLAAFSAQISNKMMPRKLTEAISQAKRINPLFKYLDGPEGADFFDAASSFPGAHKLIKQLFNRKKRQMSKSVQMSGTIVDDVEGAARAEASKLLPDTINADLKIAKSIKTVFNKASFLRFFK